MEDQSLYNQITVINIDDEDFIFSVNREQYIIGAGETRVFPKFMVRPMLKHLVDKLLIKKDPDGKLLRNQQMRDELAARIVLKEEQYEKPHTPTDREIVDNMNRQPELDRILARNQERVKTETIIPAPKVNTQPDQTPKKDAPLVTPKVQAKKEAVVEKTSQPVNPEPKSDTFDQLEEEKNRQIPSRQDMMDYAKNTLKLDISEPKTKKAWDAMSDEQLYVELGLDKEADLESLGL